MRLAAQAGGAGSSVVATVSAGVRVKSLDPDSSADNVAFDS